ncbi:PREDICTED: cysteine-rich receptor-like protein kinase 1 [Camelina sativa]|uniref:Cysteine-rich receptor-like protein kinase 1 n=1 Tax=Camelina sativa TaxID=90675 RepID=A0ABM0WWC9_CAMSA|nr:PREDICTED: cysteine-rich receptor-like protein kinase 1 [Camelina sativa]
MQICASIAQFLAWVSLLVLLPTVGSSSSSKPLLNCQPLLDHQHLVNPSRRHVDLLRVMSSVNDLISDDKLWVLSSSSTDVSPPIYVFLQCREDLSVSHCRRCFNESRVELERKCSRSAGRVYSDECFLRFDDRDFSEEFVDPRFDRAKCEGTESGFGTFWKYLDDALVNVTLKAVKNGGFGAASVIRDVAVYALAQCWQTLDENSCRECLVNARSSLRDCDGHEATAFFTGCYLKYSTHKFFDDAAELKPDHRNFIRSSFFPNLSDHDVTKLAIAAVSLCILTSLGAFISYRRFSRKRKAQIPSCSNFKYEMLEKATESFHDSMKLGQGRAGSVYKGILPDGRIVAVKKLFFNTREWADQFFNEVNLISRVEHKNLVRLLGCSIEGPKSLLVYEYVHNRSLDQILFMKNTVHILSWKQRFNMIMGISEGLEYLHRGSEVKIIHRDIKTSNILLDRNLSPKIADFGLVRSMGTDKTQTNTGIAGTLGYLAPEYLIKGQLTEKADVYAFGVLIIEIATGKKNNAFTQGTSSVLYSVWEHFKANTLEGSIDPRLKEKVTEEEALKVLQIGLLCVQSSVELRPSMSEIVYMLKNKDCKFDCPKQPPFLSASVLMPDEETRV